MTWKNGRELATASKTGTSISYTYDGDGVRTSKTVGNVTYNYVYASGKLMRQTWGTNVMDFIYDDKGAPYAMKYNGTTYYYVLNLQGDVIAIMNSAGSRYGIYRYDAWGNITYQTNSSILALNPIRYRGYVYDTELEMYYLQSRYYDPEIGRFINADQFTSTGQDFAGYNMFAYCGNNPVSRKDNGGAFWNIAAGAVIGGLISAVSQIVSNVLDGDAAWYDGLALATVTGAASGALSATGFGKVAQVIGNAAIGFAGEHVSQLSDNSLGSSEGMWELGVAAFAGGLSGIIGGKGMRHTSGNYYAAAQAAKDTATKVFGKTYGNPQTPVKLLSRAISLVNNVGRRESFATGVKFVIGCITSQLITRNSEVVYDYLFGSES